MMLLIQRISTQQPIGEIGAYLDQLSSQERLEQIRTLRKQHQKKLYQLAGDAESLDLDFFVPTQESCKEVIHNGKNSLPVFSLFQKRFCRSNDGSGRIFGYNQGSTTSWIGPGYFVAKATQENPQWLQHGSVVIDYHEVPNAEVPATWPEIRPNHQGLQRLVYHRMQDFMRRVSKHVSIGVAYQNGKNMNQYFVLCRSDEQ